MKPPICTESTTASGRAADYATTSVASPYSPKYERYYAFTDVDKSTTSRNREMGVTLGLTYSVKELLPLTGQA